MTKKITCAIIRGGTSKGVFIEENALPQDPHERERVILSVFGSPDARQIDGLGGADPLTSKLAIVSPAKNKDADINYTFGQVGIDKAEINYNAVCGNLAAGVAIYAVYKKYVTGGKKKTTVRIYNTNTKKFIYAYVPM